MSKKTHFEAMQMAQTYAIEHSEVSPLVELFIRAAEHPKTQAKIQIGKLNKENDAFEVMLTSNVRFLKILFSEYDGEPQVLLRNNSNENICLFNLAFVKNIGLSEKVIYPEPLSFERQIITFNYRENDFKLVLNFQN